MTPSSPRENAERAVEMRALIEASGLSFVEVAAMLNMTKSAVSHKVAGRRAITTSELASMREELASLNPARYRIVVDGSDGMGEPAYVSAVSVAAALRSLAVTLEGRDTPNLESSPPS